MSPNWRGKCWRNTRKTANAHRAVSARLRWNICATTTGRRFSAAALEYLRNHHWPGNLPQLCNVVKNLALTALAEEITAQEAGQALAQFNPEAPAERSVLPLDLPLREARDEFERVYFEHQIKKAGGNMSRVADYAGLERTHLYRKLKQLGIR
jgi:two-component system, NtrC family, nitrogen regulation response regulator NtrX